MTKFYFSITFILVCSLIYAQNQKLADSLIKQYNSSSYVGNELDILKQIAKSETDFKKSLEYSELLIKKASKDSLFDFLHEGHLQKGNALQLMGNNALALESYFLSLKYADRIGDEGGKGGVLLAIAGTYAAMENIDIAMSYFNKGIQLLRNVNDSINIAKGLINAGDAYYTNGKLDSALIYTREANFIFQQLNSQIGQAYSLGNMGMVFADQGDDTLAEENIKQSIKILEELEDYYPISVYLTYMSNIYLRKGNFPKALSYAQRSLELAQKYNLKEQISDANLQLSNLYEQNGNFEASNIHLKNYYTFRDSVLNIETVAEMADLRTNYEVSQKQIEVNLLNEQKRNQRITVIATIVALVLIALLAVGLFRRNRLIQRTSAIIEQEMDRSDTLLLNILPKETALELKEKGKVEAKKFNSISVLFTDFKSFTKHSSKLSPSELVESVDFYYSKFDEIMEKYGIEKIKTMGDSYMAAGGLHFHSEDHAYSIVQAAIEIVNFVKKSKKNHPEDQSRFDIRIGINSGPVVAGVVGTKKFAYDIWGDTVNIASRMESNSKSGKINISENTYLLIKDQIRCTYRGEIEAKNKGMMKMYFVDGLDNNLSLSTS